jgi:hypothetical protein
MHKCKSFLPPYLTGFDFLPADGSRGHPHCLGH